MKKNLKCFLITFFIIAICNNYLYASDLKWDASTGEVSGYKIYYGISQGSYPFSEDVGNVTQYSLNDFSLNEGVTYYFVVRAYNDSGESIDSNITTYAVPEAGDTTPPLAPVGALGVIENGDILLTWTPNSEADISLYRVYYGTSSRNYGLPIPVTGTEYSLSGLGTDILYYLAITAVDSSGNESGYSSPEIIKTISVGGENIPGPLLTWDGATGDVLGYKIYYGTTAGNYTASVDVGNVTQYSLANFQLTVGITYYFAIKAYNDYGESGISNAVSYTIGELEDVEAPSISIESPTTDPTYGTKSDTLNISGTASDAVGVTQVAWSNSSGGSGIAEGTTSWSVAGITLAEGENVITVTVSDEAGNTSTDALSVVSTIPDTAPPVIAITLPTAETTFTTSQSTIEISGTASDNIGVAQVEWWSSAGAGGVATGSVNWIVNTIDLIEGENVISITARDDAGNESTDTLTVVYTIPDTTAPTVTITSPTSGATFATGSNTLNIGGTASDDIDVTQVAWSNSRGGSGMATGTTSWSAAGITLGVGENVITVTVSDEAGNTSTGTLTVVYTIPDTTAPTVTITSPTSGATFATGSNTLNIGGTASDAVGVTQVAWSNSSGGSGIAEGTTSWSVAGITLAEGENVITVTVSDEAGNTSTDILTIEFTIPVFTDIQAPVLQVNEPTTGWFFFTRQATVKFTGTASDNIGVKSVKWAIGQAGNGVANGTSNWEAASVPLARYWNNVTITAEDAAGNKTDSTFIVFSWR